MIMLVVAACGSAAPTPAPTATPTRAPEHRVITGTVVLYNNGPVQRHGAAADGYTEENLPGPDNTFPCAGTDKFADVDTDAPIAVFDGTGSQLGQATLVDDVTGTYDKFPKAFGGLKTARIVTQCFYTFEIDDVADASEYAFKVGNQDPLTFSSDDLATRNWIVALTIGA
jgi:hypothetical protein